MAYEFEVSEWRAAVSDMTEMERAATEVAERHSVGMCGSTDDVKYGGGW